MDGPICFLDENLPYFEFSNFSPHGFVEEGIYWPTVEHYFQAQKFPDSPHREAIRKAPTPEQARELGQSRAHPLRPGWSRIREDSSLNLQAGLPDREGPKSREYILGYLYQ